MKTKVQADELRNMNAEELALAEKNTAEQVWKMRFQLHTGQLQNTAGMVGAKKKLAQIKTIQAERKLGIAATPQEV